MKPKLTTENKTKIFQLYTGQKVGVQKLYGIDVGGVTVDYLTSLDCLELRPLSSITDEEIMELGHLHTKETFLYYINTLGVSQLDCDRLRLMGFAAPWCGWSVEELVKEGVFKLKE